MCTKIFGTATRLGLLPRKARIDVPLKDGNGGYFKWATVELKRQTRSIQLQIRHMKRRDQATNASCSFNQFSSPLGQQGFGALWQIIAYTISDVWTCLARTGAETPVSKDDGCNDVPLSPTYIPFAILACAIVEEKGSAQMSRFAFGNVIIPDICGERFSFNLLNSGTFETRGPAVSESVSQAAAAYIKVLMFGVLMGSSLKERALSREKVHSMTGRMLQLFELH